MTPASTVTDLDGVAEDRAHECRACSPADHGPQRDDHGPQHREASREEAEGPQVAGLDEPGDVVA